MLAAIRPDEWNLPLFVHVAGAMVLICALVVVAASLLRATSAGGDTAALGRFGQRTLLFGALPAFIVMRAGAQWVASEEDVDEEATWITIGFITSELGLLLLIVAAVMGVVAQRKGRVSRAAGWIVVGLLVLYTIAVWAMTAKPT